VKKLLPIIGIMVTMVVLIYLDSPYSLINKDYVGVTSIPNEVLQAEATAEEAEVVTSDSDMVEDEKNTDENENEEFISDYTLEMIFEERMIEGDYIIEEYREYEVFRDENGNIIKSIPTSNFDYIRYYTEQ
jgi:hypothetical protein